MDYTMCRGNGCPLNETCKRYTSTPSQYQSWFADEPFRIIEGKFNCDLYWATNQIDIFEQTNEEHGQTGADKQTNGGEEGVGGQTKGD